jgi:hypothetical protein
MARFREPDLPDVVLSRVQRVAHSSLVVHIRTPACTDSTVCWLMRRQRAYDVCHHTYRKDNYKEFHVNLLSFFILFTFLDGAKKYPGHVA